jgi:hypothetical protein
MTIDEHSQPSQETEHDHRPDDDVHDEHENRGRLVRLHPFKVSRRCAVVMSQLL